jgi:hypothetical protein
VFAVQRATLAEIQCHPWFLCDLPEGAAGMNAWYVANSPDLDWVSEPGSQGASKWYGQLADGGHLGDATCGLMQWWA